MNYKTTSNEQKLGKGPGDMPDRGKGKPKPQTSSNMIDLNRAPHPVANLENKASMGQVQCGSEKSDLGRAPTPPYGDLSATTPHTPFGGKRSKR